MINNEDLERKMVFIVDQQAQFVVDIEKLQAAQTLTAQSIEKLQVAQAFTAQRINETNDVVTRLAYVTNEGFKDVNAKIDAMVSSQIRTDDQIRSLTESQKKTDEKFRTLLERLDRRSDNGDDTD